mmetsp:Transcript_77595/g.225183  ORF Transcript_77595/g.225183 Transcript_77595/m.225183 type:complete len:263 (-) Transcript_77595:1796-2584(-)
MSKSVKSKGPRFGECTTFRMMRSCTMLEWAIALDCQASSTSQNLSIAFGSLLRRSIFVSWASLRARNNRWDCWVRICKLVGKVSTSLRMSFHVWSTARQVFNLSLPNLTTASTTPLQSPKRSGKTSERHFQSSSSKRYKSPNSIAACSGGNSRSTTLMCSVTSRSVRSCSSVCLRASSSLRSAAAFSSAALRSYSARNSEVLRCISFSSAAILRSHSPLKASICLVISAFSSASRLRSASNSVAFFSNLAFICACSSASLRS